MAYELGDAAGDVADMLSAAETIENASYVWGAPNIELAAAELKRALSKVAGAIEHWTGETMSAESGDTPSAFRWLESITTPDGESIVGLANMAQELTTELFKAHRLYQQGDTLRALDAVERCYRTWGTKTVNALIGAMRADCLQPRPLDPELRSFRDAAPDTEVPGNPAAGVVVNSTSAPMAQQG